MEEHSALVYKWRLLPDFGATMGCIPKRHQLLPCTGFTPSAARFVHNNIISKEGCRVFMLRCQSTSHLTCFVSFHRVHPSYAIIQSYSHLQFIQSHKSHSFIHSCNYTLILSHINAYTTYKQYQFIHGCISHPLVWSYPFVSVFKLSLEVCPKQWTTWFYFFILFQATSPNRPLEFTFLSSFKPSVPTDRLSLPFILFQAASPNGPLEFTFLSGFKPPVLTDRLNLPFYLVSSRQSQRTAWVHLLSCFKPPVLTDHLRLPFLSCFKLPVLTDRLRLPFLSCFKLPVLTDRLSLSVISFQAASPNGPFEFIFYLVSSRQS